MWTQAQLVGKLNFLLSGTTLLPLRNSLEMQTELSRVFQLDPPNRKVPEKGLSRQSYQAQLQGARPLVHL